MTLKSGLSKSTTTALPPTDADHILVEIDLNEVPASVPTAAQPPLGKTDADLYDTKEDDSDVPLSLGFKLTVFRLLNIIVIFTIGVATFTLFLKGQSIASTRLEWAVEPVLAILLYCISLCEAVEQPRWKWFFHVVWAPVIGFALKGFRGGVLWWPVDVWKYFPFYLAIFMYITRLGFFPDTIIWGTVNSCLSAWLAFLLWEGPMQWLVWQHIPIWAPVRRFFLVYQLRSGNSAGGQSRLIGKVGFWIGFLLGYVLSVELLTRFATTYLIFPVAPLG